MSLWIGGGGAADEPTPVNSGGMIDDVGAHCSIAECHQLDFLPFTCKYCKKVFCSEHRLPHQHACSVDITAINSAPQCPLCNQFVRVPANGSPDKEMNAHMASGCKDNLVQASQHEKDEKRQRKHCSRSGCHNPNNFDTVQCAKCHQRFCLPHRHPVDHDCAAEKAKQSVKPAALAPTHPTQNSDQKEQKAVAVSAVAAPPKPVPLTAKQQRQASVERMRVRSAAVGDKSMSESLRFALLVETPQLDITGHKLKPLSGLPGMLKDKGSAICMFFNRNWTIGKVIDVAADKLRLTNRNDKAKEKHLELFHKHTQSQFPWDCPLGLLEPELLGGDPVQLRYV